MADWVSDIPTVSIRVSSAADWPIIFRFSDRACGFDMAHLVERLLFAVGEVVVVGFTGKVSEKRNYGHTPPPYTARTLP